MATQTRSVGCGLGLGCVLNVCLSVLLRAPKLHVCAIVLPRNDGLVFVLSYDGERKEKGVTINTCSTRKLLYGKKRRSNDGLMSPLPREKLCNSAESGAREIEKCAQGRKTEWHVV
ncbi:unnamed protein product [Ectocarpus sp. 12 AP-2014]